MDKLEKQRVPMIAFNTTAGTNFIICGRPTDKWLTNKNEKQKDKLISSTSQQNIIHLGAKF